MTKTPDFFCLGVQKAGTTWLYENMCTHPDFSPPLFKEPHYFDTLYNWVPAWGPQGSWDLLPLYQRISEVLYWKLIQQKAPCDSETFQYLTKIAALYEAPLTDAWYAKFFEDCSAGQITGDFTPENCLINDAGIQHLTTVNPAAKYILLLRDPVERDWAQLRMNLPAESAEQSFLAATREEDFNRRSDYETIILRWRNAVSPERLYIGFFDDLRERPTELLNAVAAFLGVPQHDWPLACVVSLKGREQAMSPTIHRRLAYKNSRTLEYMADAFPNPCRQWKVRHLPLSG